MAKLPECRLLLETEPNSGAWNMAVDAVLLESAVTQGIATFRWYRWSEPTLSLGYFQKSEDIAGDPSWNGLPTVRRLSGGGAILHHHEWTYSFAVPADRWPVSRPEELYDVVHAAIMGCLRECGCELQLRGKTGVQSPEPILCFSRRDAHDVVCRGHKVLGSAQRRRKGAILQHGSLLMRHSPLTPQHSGLEDLGWSNRLGAAELSAVPRALAERVASSLLTAVERGRVEEQCGQQAVNMNA